MDQHSLETLENPWSDGSVPGAATEPAAGPRAILFTTCVTVCRMHFPHVVRLLLVSAWVVGCGAEERDPPERGVETPGPEIALLRPAESLAIAPGVPVAIEWTSTAAERAATVDILADRDGDPSTTTDQLPLSLGNPATTSPTVFTWQTDEAPLGTYHVIARTGDHVTVAAGVVEIVAPLLRVENLEEGERLRYPLALLTGAVPTDVEEVSAGLLDDPLVAWPATAGQFKTLVRLAPGENDVILAAGGVLHRFSLDYEPSANPRFVRLIYVLPADGEGEFDAPAGEPNDAASAARRIATAAELMQTFTAEKLHAQGFGRRTFRLVRDDSGVPVVEIFRSKLTLAEARAMEDGTLFTALYRAFARMPSRDESIDVAVMSMTHWDPVRQDALAHMALGTYGGRLGLFGSGGLHTWAESLDEVAARFLDDRRIDTGELFDDSAYRGTYWANYATGVGATLHELGHCFSLPHPANGEGVMSRGFDHFNRTFMTAEPESDVSPALLPVLPEHETGWDRSAAVRLGFHRWLDPDDVAHAVDEAPALALDAASVTVSSAAGIRHIAWSVSDAMAGHDEYLAEPPPSVTVTKEALRERFDATSIELNVIDADGNIAWWEFALE